MITFQRITRKNFEDHLLQSLIIKDVIMNENILFK